MATKTANVMARVEPSVKARAESVLDSLGISASVVINALYHQIIYTKSVPFSMALPSGIPSLKDMDTETFNMMMETGLKQAESGEGIDLKTAFDDIRSKI